MDTTIPEMDATDLELFSGSDPTSARLRAVDWGRTPLGPCSEWTDALRAAIRTVLPARVPMLLWWGADLVQIYNDAYAHTIGDKHPAALGQLASQCWLEVWDELGPLTEQATAGETVYAHELPLMIRRSGYDEETFWTFSFSPVRDAVGEVGGMLVVAADSTESVIRGRRLRVLGEIGALSSADIRSVDEVLCRATECLASHPGKVAFAVVRSEDEPEGPLRVAAHFGLEEGTDLAAAPGEVGLLSDVMKQCATLEEDAPPGGWPVLRTVSGATVTQAIHLPLVDRGEDRPAGVLTVGVNPHRALDADYRFFLDLLVHQMSTVMSDARAIERERERVDALAALDRAKTRFLQNVSHELRTPLTLIMGAHRSLEKREDLPAVAREEVALAGRSAQRLSRLVDGLLDIARAEENVLAPAPVPIALDRLTREIVAMFESAVISSGLDLEVDIGGEMAPVLVDPEMWSQIVSNLVSNAFKFTAEGSIRVSLGVEDDEVVLVVADTGAGMNLADQTRAFERFQQFPGSSQRTAEGAGIGLALVRDLTDLHRGAVEVVSAPGEGSRFTVRMPLPVASEEAVPIEPALARARPLADEAGSWSPAASRSSASDEAGSSSSLVPRFVTSDDASGTEDGYILLVEDNTDLRHHLTGLLEADGWPVVGVGDVGAALAQPARPLLVLTDGMLPGADGIELVHALRNQTVTADIPVILLTARAEPDGAAEGLNAGATDYLTKPFDVDELLARVRTHAQAHLRRRAALKEANLTIGGLQVAVETNRQIGAATGILMARLTLTQDQAFDLLRRASQDQNRKLRDIADEVVLTGAVPL